MKPNKLRRITAAALVLALVLPQEPKTVAWKGGV